MGTEIWQGEDEETLSGRFAGVIRRACEQSGRGVVVLVDEYDKPLLQALGDDALLDDYRKTLKAFYGVLKSSDRYLRFVFLTGVTKFAQVSVFSDLNQLNDISMKPQYATICGITRQELEDTFIPELNRLAETNELTYEETLNKMTALYDGYHFVSLRKEYSIHSVCLTFLTGISLVTIGSKPVLLLF